MPIYLANEQGRRDSGKDEKSRIEKHWVGRLLPRDNFLEKAR